MKALPGRDIEVFGETRIARIYIGGASVLASRFAGNHSARGDARPTRPTPLVCLAARSVLECASPLALLEGAIRVGARVAHPQRVQMEMVGLSNIPTLVESTSVLRLGQPRSRNADPVERAGVRWDGYFSLFSFPFLF